jgi:hypothetical protein
VRPCESSRASAVPRESRCGICIDPSKTAAVNELRAQGVPFRDIAGRLKIPKSSVARHAQHSGLSPRRAAARKPSRKPSQTGQSRLDRCRSCGISKVATDVESLILRAEWVIWTAETIAAQAQANEDPRLTVMATDRVTRGVELLLKVRGALQPDGAVTVNVDARMQVAQMFESLPETTLRALQNGDCPHCHQALVASSAALPASENGTPIRDETSL